MLHSAPHLDGIRTDRLQGDPIMAQGQGVGEVDVRVAGIAQSCVVVVAKDASWAVIAQRAEPEPGHIAHDVRAAIAQRGLRLGHPHLGLYTLAPLALHRFAALAWVRGELGDSWRNNLVRGVQPKIEGGGGLGRAPSGISEEKVLADPDSAGLRTRPAAFHHFTVSAFSRGSQSRNSATLESQSAVKRGPAECIL